MSSKDSTCLDCHERCATCIGPTEFDCISCTTLLHFEVATNKCIEDSPDDGAKYGDYECEDDDSVAGDGCYNGNIEPGWTCDGGTTSTPDVCYALPSV